MKKLKTLHLVLFVFLVLAISACTAQQQTAPVANNANIAEEEAVTEEIAEEAVVEEDTEEVESVEETSSFPVTIDNCGLSITYSASPEKAVTMNQAATEIMLALGLEDHMVGTAYLDDVILPEFEEAYASITVLAEKYPSQEVFLNADPDFVFGVYKSAFGEKAAGPREDLLNMNINSYLSVDACEDESYQPEKTTFEVLFEEIRDIGKIFGAEDRSETLIAEMQAQLDEALASTSELESSPTIFWYDSGDDAPFVGASTGTPAMIMDAVGATNIFADTEGTWATVSWEEVLERNPDVIVVIDASWSTAQEKIDLLVNDPQFSSITAVQNNCFIVLPFSSSTLGIRNIQAVVDLAEGLVE